MNIEFVLVLVGVVLAVVEGLVAVVAADNDQYDKATYHLLFMMFVLYAISGGRP